MADLSSTYAQWTPRLLSILRIITGLLFMQHGAQKLFGIPTPMGPLPTLIMVAGVLEFLGGLLILLGLFTRPVAFILAGEMAVAYFMGHFPKSFFPAINGGDAAILYCFVFLLLVFAGPGAWSLDAARARGSAQPA